MEVPPPPESLSPEEVRKRALAVIAADKFPVLATCDGVQPRVRPVSPVRIEGFTVYIASLRSSSKTGELDRNPYVELCFMDAEHNQVRITGIGESVTNPHIRQLIWETNPLVRAYLKSLDNPEFMLYVVAPARVRYMKEWAIEYHEVAFRPPDKDGKLRSSEDASRADV